MWPCPMTWTVSMTRVGGSCSRAACKAAEACFSVKLCHLRCQDFLCQRKPGAPVGYELVCIVRPTHAEKLDEEGSCGI